MDQTLKRCIVGFMLLLSAPISATDHEQSKYTAQQLQDAVSNAVAKGKADGKIDDATAMVMECIVEKGSSWSDCYNEAYRDKPVNSQILECIMQEGSSWSDCYNEAYGGRPAGEAIGLSTDRFLDDVWLLTAGDLRALEGQ